MKTITPIQCWKNGQLVEATILDARVINDNLIDAATFYYSIKSVDNTQVAEGNLSMTGSDYDLYETNQYAYDWVANQLNLTITGEYVEPVIVQPTPETPTVG